MLLMLLLLCYYNKMTIIATHAIATHAIATHAIATHAIAIMTK
jgi:hypothetical protein